jgi:hypothetical protein
MGSTVMPSWIAGVRPAEISPWLTIAGYLALILALYGVKALVLSPGCNRMTAVILFLAVAAAAVPVTYILSPDWGKIYIAPIAIYVGDPVTLLAVPCASFARDWSRRPPSGGWRDWLWRAPLEIIIVIPAWLVICVGISLLLGWVWI